MNARISLAASVGLAALSALIALSLPACNGPGGGVDYFSQVGSACQYTDVNPNIIEVTDAERVKTSLRPDCRAALLKILPFDATFDAAPAGLKDKVMESFQVMLAYPLKFPDKNRIFGVAPWSIPLGFLCGVMPEMHPDECQVDLPQNDHPNLNQDIFNFTVNNIDRLTYKPSSLNSGASASMVPTAAGERVMTIYDLFWKNDIVVALFRTPYTNASTLVHEARHADGYLHTTCPTMSGFNCDEELSGPYGYEVAYQELLLQGSGEAKDADGKYLLSLGHIMILGTTSCSILHDQVIHLPPELRTLVNTPESCQSIGARWVVEHEGLHRDDLP